MTMDFIKKVIIAPRSTLSINDAVKLIENTTTTSEIQNDRISTTRVIVSEFKKLIIARPPPSSLLLLMMAESANKIDEFIDMPSSPHYTDKFPSWMNSRIGHILYVSGTFNSPVTHKYFADNSLEIATKYIESYTKTNNFSDFNKELVVHSLALYMRCISNFWFCFDQLFIKQDSKQFIIDLSNQIESSKGNN